MSRSPNKQTTPRTEVTSADGHRFGVWRLDSDDVTQARLVFLSALGTPARVYLGFAMALARTGTECWLPDWRGIDSSSWRAHRTCDFGYRELLEQDIVALLAAMPQDDLPLWIGGHSLGGQLALLTCATRSLAGTVLIASGSVHRNAYPFRYRLGISALTALSTAAAATLGYFPGRRIGFGGREARGVMRDWASVAHSGAYRPHGSGIDYEAALARMSQPVLALNFKADRWSPWSAAQTLLVKAPQAKAQSELWDRDRCSGLTLDHYSWTRHPSLVAPRIAEFIATQI